MTRGSQIGVRGAALDVEPRKAAARMASRGEGCWWRVGEGGGGGCGTGD
jgi:hypothetical protein